MVIKYISKIKNFFNYVIIEDLYLYLFSFNKKEFVNNQFYKILNKYKNRKLDFWWEYVTLKVLTKISKFGFSNFLRIRLITDTMFVDDERNFKKYLKLVHLEKDYEFIKENLFGNPILSKNANFTSINKLHQFYHLKYFSKLSSLRYSDTFIELGGGYGLLCLLCIKYLKVKKYIIYDLEGFLQIQKVYLRKILSNSEFNKIEFISDVNVLNKKVLKIKKYNFLGFWSFSEMNFKIREQFVNIIRKSNFFLLGYQNYFFEINNYQYFKKFTKKLNNFSTIKKKHPCYPNDFYLFGKKTKKS